MKKTKQPQAYRRQPPYPTRRQWQVWWAYTINPDEELGRRLTQVEIGRVFRVSQARVNACLGKVERFLRLVAAGGRPRKCPTCGTIIPGAWIPQELDRADLEPPGPPLAGC